MGYRPQKPHYTAALRRRRLLRYAAISFLFLFSLTVLLDHFGCFGYRGDDWAHFDGRSFTIRSVTDHATLTIAGRDVEVRLLGVEVPGTQNPTDHWAAQAKAYLTDRLAGKTAILRLEPLQTRDAVGRLLAYIYLSDGDCFNVDIVRDGSAYADRRQKHSMQAPIEGAETDARKHARGLWKELKESQMPAWRREWLKDRHTRDEE